ncbi:MAG: BtpA/SgcQ family protein [Acidimicrobiia bacterium]
MPDGGGLFAANAGTLVGMIHLPAMPGSPRHDGRSVREIEGRAIDEALLLQRAGFDAAMLQNTGNGPGRKDADAAEVAQMAAIGRAIRAANDLPLGINVLKNGVASAFALASALDAAFVRIKVYVGAVVGSEGIVEGAAHAALSERRRLGLDHVAILADIADRTSRRLPDTPVSELASWAVSHGSADALVVTGRDLAETHRMLEELREAGVGVPLVVGGGAETSNIADLLTRADSIIVGTALKDDPAFDAPLSERRVADFVAAARRQAVAS